MVRDYSAEEFSYNVALNAARDGYATKEQLELAIAGLVKHLLCEDCTHNDKHSRELGEFRAALEKLNG